MAKNQLNCTCSLRICLGSAKQIARDHTCVKFRKIKFLHGGQDQIEWLITFGTYHDINNYCRFATIINNLQFMNPNLLETKKLAVVIVIVAGAWLLHDRRGVHRYDSKFG